MRRKNGHIQRQPWTSFHTQTSPSNSEIRMQHVQLNLFIGLFVKAFQGCPSRDGPDQCPRTWILEVILDFGGGRQHSHQGIQEGGIPALRAFRTRCLTNRITGSFFGGHGKNNVALISQFLLFLSPFIRFYRECKLYYVVMWNIEAKGRYRLVIFARTLL